MRITTLVATVAVIADLFSTAPLGGVEPVDLVDQRIGSISHLLVPISPVVHVPFGLARVQPVVGTLKSDPYMSSRLEGLCLAIDGHRGQQVGILSPFVGDPALRLGNPGSEVLKQQEKPGPDRYSVFWEEDGVQIEATTSRRCAIDRMTFPAGAAPGILLRLTGTGRIEQVDATTLRFAQEITQKNGNPATVYAVLRLSAPAVRTGTWNRGQVAEGQATQGPGGGLWIALATGTTTVEVAVGLSFIDHAQAAKALDVEVGKADFNGLHKASRALWNQHLGAVKVSGGGERQQEMLYTALERGLERMTDISEDGRYYSVWDGRVHEDARPFYTDDWTWDTYRSLHPLRLLMWPQAETDMVQSFVRMYQQSGWMPKFPQANGDWSCMIGNHQAALIADTYLKGHRDFDIASAYEGLRKNAFEGTALPWRRGPGSALDRPYRTLGYMPALEPGKPETEPNVHDWEKRQPVAVTLEHAFDDYCLARLAKALGHDEDAAILAKRATWWRNLWRPDVKFFAPRLENGEWLNPFDPVLGGGPGARQIYAEMNGWTYLWAVPHDVEGLMTIMGGAKAMSARLDEQFSQTPAKPDKWVARGIQPDATGQIGQFFASNEQSFNIPYFHVWTGEPWKTQRRVRQVIDAYFRPDPMGIAGDEDGGAMSAWYVFSAMGFFPTCQATSTYIIGSPLFDHVELALGNGKTFTVDAPGAGSGKGFITAATLNGKAIDRAWFTHDELMAGGTLTLVMDRMPNKAWGSRSLPPTSAP